jgi:hypothetical protein
MGEVDPQQYGGKEIAQPLDALEDSDVSLYILTR